VRYDLTGKVNCRSTDLVLFRISTATYLFHDLLQLAPRQWRYLDPYFPWSPRAPLLHSNCIALLLRPTELIRTAKLINGFASTLKQVGTIVKEDDRLPSHEVGIRSSISLALWCLKVVTRDFVKAIAVPKSLRWILIQPGDKSLYTAQIWYCINLHVPTTYRSQTNDPVL
jgi:hypothetical protein